MTYQVKPKGKKWIVEIEDNQEDNKMNGEEFISMHLIRSAKCESGIAVKVTNNIIDKAVLAYRENSFNNLQDLIQEAEEKIISITQMINELSKDGGVTAKTFARSTGVCVATARKKLNSSLLAVKNYDKKPYIYTLTNEL